ncbi:MAG: hypothetical protein QOG21_144, partial [Actinomycetota bacterium]|nr:hypothetical protein [Actinomycetota bacterium]
MRNPAAQRFPLGARVTASSSTGQPPFEGSAWDIRFHEVPFQCMTELPTANALEAEIAVTLFGLFQPFKLS